jgi:S-layer protein (TIGR01567 family)
MTTRKAVRIVKMQISAIIGVATIIVILVTASTAAQEIDVRSLVHNLSENEVSWSSYNFSGFYYDVDDDIGYEALTFRLSNISQAKDRATLADQPDANGNRGAVYIATAQPTPFSFGPWGQYGEIFFLGGDYFAAFDSNLTWNQDETEQLVPILYDKSESKNLMSDELLSEILQDNDTEMTINSSQPLGLFEGYRLTIKSIDNDGKKVHLELSKDGQVVDSKVIQPSVIDADMSDETYYYKKDLGDARGVIIIAVHFKDAFRSGDRNIATIDGIFQISDSPISIKADQKYDKMSLREVDPTARTIRLDNRDNPITFGVDRDITLMGKIHIQTADQDQPTVDDPLRYFIYSNESCGC